jgi:hypothetical protein
MRTIPRSRVAPFGIRRLIARLQLPVDVSPLSASFFGSWPLRHPPNTPPCLAVPFPFVHLHTAHGRPTVSRRSSGAMRTWLRVLVRPQQASGYAYPHHHITCMRSLRFSLSSHRQNCSNHIMRLEKCLKNSSLDNWRVRNSVGAKP